MNRFVRSIAAVALVTAALPGAVGMLVAALLWAWVRPKDPRGRGVALNSSLLCYMSSAVWLVAIAMVYVWPRLAGR